MGNKTENKIPQKKRLFMDLTEGCIWKQLIIYAFPLLCSSLIQQLYNTVDLMFIGQMVGKEAAAAVGSSSLFITCIVGFFTGMSIGTNILAARFLGEQNFEKLKSMVSVSTVLSIAGGLIMTVLAYVLTPVFLDLLRVPDDIFKLSEKYLQIYIFSLLPIAVYNTGAGILRGLGDSRSPTLYQLIGGICNVIANIVFVGLLDWGVLGAAVTTVCSQGMAAVLIFRHLCRLDNGISFCIKKIQMTLADMKDIMIVSIPAGVQAISITLSNLIVQSRINDLGVDSIAAFTSYFKVELFIYLPIMAIGQASVTFTGQNIGAKKLDRALKGLKVSLFLGLVMTVLTSAFIMLLCGFVLRLFTKDMSVIAIGIQIIRVTVPFYFIYVFLEVFSAFIRGSGRILSSTLIVLVNMCVFRPLCVTFLSNLQPNATTIAWVYPITWFTSSVCLFIYFLWIRKALITSA